MRTATNTRCITLKNKSVTGRACLMLVLQNAAYSASSDQSPMWRGIVGCAARLSDGSRTCRMVTAGATPLEQQAPSFNEPRVLSDLRAPCEAPASRPSLPSSGDGGAPYLQSYMMATAPAVRRLNMLSPFSVPDAPAFAAPGPVRRSTVQSAAGVASEAPPLPPRRRSAGSADTGGHLARAHYHGSAAPRALPAALSGGERSGLQLQGLKSEADGWARDGMPSSRHEGRNPGPQLLRNSSGGVSSGIPPRPNRVVARVARRPPVMSPFAAGGDYPVAAPASAPRPQHDDTDVQREMSKEDFDELAAELAIGPRSASGASARASYEPPRALPVAHSIAAVEARKLERYLREEIDLEREPADSWRDGHHTKRRPPSLTPQVWAA